MTEQTPAEADEPEAAADDANDDDAPGRDPDAQAAVDEVTGGHSTRLKDPSEGSTKSDFRTPPGIPGGIDPGTLADRDT
ncbi:MAG: hypothetical protein QOE31_2231 [Solirubrobacteraceae bacterium]|jgi:hypothetical protein|nr:hypothetical protein [Solirubrobacteraceae bacterium]